MAETFAQRRRNVNLALRALRKAYRKADSTGEALERELDRLIERKTFVTAASMESLTQLCNSYWRAANDLQQPLVDAHTIAVNALN